MEYRKFGDAYIVRLDRDEEILAQLKIFAEKEQVKTGLCHRPGGCEGLHRRSVRLQRQGLQVQPLPGVYEIVSLVGTINTMNDAFYCHLHMCAADQEATLSAGI